MDINRDNFVDFIFDFSQETVIYFIGQEAWDELSLEGKASAMATVTKRLLKVLADALND